MKELPKGAMRLVENGEGCFALAVTDGDKPPKMKMVAYSGGIIKDHWYWDDLAIDLKGMSFPASKFPILEDHDTSRKVAFTGKPVIADNSLSINPDTTQFLDSEASQEFQTNSQKGFPYQASIYAKPSSVERVMKGESAEVNGMSVKGPASIWRKCEFREASVCVFGWDSRTQASAFSRTVMEQVDVIETIIGEEGLATEEGKQTVLKIINEEEVKLMDLAELHEKHPDLVTALTEEVTTSVTDTLTVKFDAEKTDLEAKLTAKDSTIEAQESRLAGLEKKDTIRTENELINKADSLWTNKLSESAVPESMFEKCRNMVKHSKFVKDDVLDITAFSEAIDTEIKDWESKMPAPSVLGFGKTSKTETTNESGPSDEEDTKLAEDMASLVGVKTT